MPEEIFQCERRKILLGRWENKLLLVCNAGHCDARVARPLLLPIWVR